MSKRLTLEGFCAELPKLGKILLERQKSDPGDVGLHHVIVMTFGMLLEYLRNGGLHAGRKPAPGQWWHTELHRQFVQVIMSWVSCQHLLRASEEKADFRTTEWQVDLLERTSAALCDLLHALPDTVCVGTPGRHAAELCTALRAYVARGEKEKLATFSEAAFRFTDELIDCVCRLERAELRLFAENPPGEGGFASGVYREALGELERFHVENPRYAHHLLTALMFFDRQSADFPAAFMRREPHAPGGLRSFAYSLRTALAVSPFFVCTDPRPADSKSYARPLWNEICAPILSDFRVDLFAELVLYTRRRARECGRNDALRRRWVEAEAALPVSLSTRNPQLTAAQLDRLLALIETAHRESRIDRAMRGHAKADEPMERLEPQRDTRTDERMLDVLGQLADALKPKPPKPPRKGRRGSGLHGLKTQKMDEQLTDFREYLGKQTVTRARNIGYWAQNWWRQNLVECEAAAKAKGERRGYADYAKLASAYRSWQRQREKSRN